MEDYVTVADETLYGVVAKRNILIPLDDGVELAADLYLPDTVGRHPTIVSFYPYRKDDFIGAAFEHSRTYLTQRGYASLLVDMRGTGGSDGDCLVTFDTAREGADGARVVEWAASEEWCDGSVGMWGMSYGGVMSLAVGAQKPPHLKAIVPVQGCADIHRDFIAPGGCRNCLGADSWAALMLAFDLAPPTFPDSDGRWIDVWRRRLARLERGEIWPLDWKSHVDHDDYWQSKEIPIEGIEMPMFAIGGWRDIFPQAMPDAYSRVTGPKKMLMGPWVHSLPDAGTYAPVDWLQEMCRFFDRWVKGEVNEIADEPPVTLYVEGAECWRHESEWPIARTQVEEWYPQAGGGLGRSSVAAGEGDLYTADPTVGTCSALWDPIGTGLGYPREQSEDDHRSLTYTSEPLDADVEITGAPEAILRVVLEQGDELQLVAKLNAVSPEGRSTLISTGWLNAEHRESAELGRPVEKGVVEEYRIEMWAGSYLVPKGHRLRLAIACSDFPRIWPLRTNPTIRVEPAGSVVRVPVVPPRAVPVEGPPVPRPDLRVNRTPWHVAPEPDAEPGWIVERDVVNDDAAVTMSRTNDIRMPTGGSHRVELSARAAAPASRPDGASLVVDVLVATRLPTGERAEVRTRSRFTRETTLMNGEVTLDGQRVFAGEWHETPEQVTR
jgi:putative CocE/NonD family hydrolase